jgi:acyl-CoA synthetase (AMP-forming)/AMP-acid ligase II
MAVPHFSMANFLNSEVKNTTALVDGSTGASRTFGELHAQTHKFARSLLDLGLKKGDCIGLMSPNHIHFFTTFQGIGVMGGVSTLIVSENVIYIF